jgi:hypothetical protein
MFEWRKKPNVDTKIELENNKFAFFKQHVKIIRKE